ncbi:hypothetical protein EI94DRAFT_1785613 [Lactarius quietus]|nr:hypothetical protein EI94DRAFT_1785613 [Lactarius quietus]
MPVLDKNADHESNRDLDREKDRDRDGKDREKGSKAKGSTKTKDLSHVPCKFFKVGSCTAGVSCPFSHANNEPGQPKGVCAWFVKGNCKFGHKCALAHILPGQSMAMDRKNKKAAQLAANANGQSKEGGKGGKSSKSGPPSATGSGTSGAGNGSMRNPLLSGSTAPTRILQSSARAPMPIPLKAAVSPSAPAPPVQDTEFASYGLPDESNKLPSAPAYNNPFPSPPKEASPLQVVEDVPPDLHAEGEEAPAVPNPSTSPLPFHPPSAPRQMRVPTNPADLGPIGSPRSVSSHGHVARVNGFSPGASPSQGAAVLSTSPFSAPGAQSVFFSYENKPNHSDDLKARSGIAASLGATHAWRPELPPGGAQDRFDEIVVEDEDFEDFVPGSLSELLTPEEKSRRYSRTHQTNAIPGTAWVANPRPSAETHHHRYSRSVPAPSLLGDIKSIWTEGSQNVIGSPRKSGVDVGAPGGAVPAVGNGTPSSFRSTSAFGSHSLADDHINSFLSPSNASAAFLPGNYQNYLSSRNAAPGTGITATVSGLRAHAPSSANGSSNVNAANLLARINDPVTPTPPAQRQPFNGTSESLGDQPFQLGRPIPATSEVRGNGEDGRSMLSPSARALQAHAPGQSLPQGLAAGYSRIHALPPPPSLVSPAASSTFAPSQTNSFAPSSSFQANASERVQFSEWIGMSPNAHPHGMTGMESLASRTHYMSATAPRPPVGPGSVTAGRNTSGKGWGTPLSPLSRPVVTGDDDDLFDMDR